MSLLRSRRRRGAAPDRLPPDEAVLALKAASVLLGYPDHTATELVALAMGDRPPGSVHGGGAHPLDRLADFVEGWTALDPMRREVLYVETFDHRRRCSLNMTYFSEGDTRNRGRSLLEAQELYRSYGMATRTGELPDYLPALLELAAEVGPEALEPHRCSIAALHESLQELGSPFATVLEVVTEIAGPPDDAERARLDRLALEGPPCEQVGLETPVDITTGPKGPS